MAIKLFRVETKTKSIGRAINILNSLVDEKTLLLLSGGTSPVALYKKLALDKLIVVGAVASVDERFGPPGHNDSNEQMVKETGLYDYFESRGAEIYKILQPNLSLEETGNNYEQALTRLFARFSKRVAIVGVGEDGHTAGIAPNFTGWTNPVFLPENQGKLALGYENPNPDWFFPKRITITPKAIKSLTSVLILAFGESKRRTLETLLYKDLPIETFPSMIYRKMDDKANLITDSL